MSEAHAAREELERQVFELVKGYEEKFPGYVIAGIVVKHNYAVDQRNGVSVGIEADVKL